MKFILASKSPRRKEILSSVCESFDIITRETDETLPEGTHPSEGVRLLAIEKGRAVFDAVGDDGAIIISSDTLVELDGEPLGKPSSESDAKRMLRMLSGKKHNVHTGIAIHMGDRLASGVATTGVYFKELSDDEISEYVSSGEPMDKAGSYGIQGLGGRFVEKIDGDFDTVVGFSKKLLFELASELGIDTKDGKLCP